MSWLVTFSSNAYVNTDTSPTERFTSFSLDSLDGQSIERFGGRFRAGQASPLAFRGPNLLDKMGELEAVATTLVARPPKRTLSGFVDAVVDEDAELVTVSLRLADNVALSGTGILTSLNFFVQGGKYGQGVDVSFWPVNRLRFVNSSTYLSDADYN